LEVLFCDQDSADTDVFGYLYILKNLLDMKHFNHFVKLARMISFENEEIIRDIQDFLIVQSLRSVGKEYFENKEKASDKMKFFTDMKNQEKAQALQVLKPPFVWNFYKSKAKQKRRFYSVNPFKEFGHLKFLEEELAFLGRELVEYNVEEWSNFQNQLIRFFNNQQIKELV
jgi:hypothetical protein